MSIDSAMPAAISVVAAEVSTLRVVHRYEPDCPRPISGKHALLHARRLRQRDARLGAQSSADGEQALRLRTEDGAVMFVLRAVAPGLAVERTQRRPLGTCLVQSLLFTDHDGFTRWCEADAIRFDEPVLYDRLRREGHARFGGER